jgi:integrase
VLPVLGRMQLRKVGIAEVRSLVFHKRDRGRPAAAIKLRDLLDRLFRYAAACGLVDENPVAGLARDFVGRLRPRTRALSESELRLFFRHLPETGRVNALALELLLLTLARKGELLAARWEHVNLIEGTWEVPAADSKSGRPHVVYLSPRALEIFKELARTAPMWALNKAGSSYVLPSQASASQPMSPAVLNKAIARVKWEMPKFSPHDLRRTASTLLNEKEYNADWIEKAMNHTVRNKIRGVYNKAEYATQRRQMLTEWAEWLEGLNAGTE